MDSSRDSHCYDAKVWAASYRGGTLPGISNQIHPGFAERTPSLPDSWKGSIVDASSGIRQRRRLEPTPSTITAEGFAHPTHITREAWVLPGLESTTGRVRRSTGRAHRILGPDVMDNVDEWPSGLRPETAN